MRRSCLFAVIPCLAAPLLFATGGCGSGDNALPAAAAPMVNVTNFQAAAVVIGQPDFVSRAVNQGGGPMANTASSPSGVATGNLWIAEEFNNRLLDFANAPTMNNAPADYVLGQPDFMSNSSVAAPTAVNFHGPLDVCEAGGRLFMASLFQSRVLIWDAVPMASGVPADIALGQPDLTTGGDNTTQTGLNQPEGICVAGGKIVVADTRNDRVMIWNSIPVASGTPADLVLGKGDFTTSGATLGAGGMSRPRGVWTDGTHLIVADSSNHRVLIWNTFPTVNGQPADVVVVGQATFATNTNGNGATGMWNPEGVSSNGTQLFVADRDNSRVLIYESIPTTNGAPATGLLGQSGFDVFLVAPNDTDQNGAGEANPNDKTFSRPRSVHVSGTQLFVTDPGNARTLIFNSN